MFVAGPLGPIAAEAAPTVAKLALDFIYRTDTMHRPDIWAALAAGTMSNGCKDCMPWHAYRW
jgi:hypothetical protein